MLFAFIKYRTVYFNVNHLFCQVFIQLFDNSSLLSDSLSIFGWRLENSRTRFITWQGFSDDYLAKVKWPEEEFSKKLAAWQQSKALSPENVSAGDQPNTELFVAYIKIKRFLFIRFITACNGDGFDRTPVSIQTNSVLRLLFQSVASPLELYISAH